MARAPTFPSRWIFAFALIIGIFLAYEPVWQAGFIWDDDLHVTANPVIVGPLGLKEIWTTQAAQYYPLVLTTFWLEHALWGLQPLPYHLVNVAMHAGCAVVLWHVLRALRVPGAGVGAALWALHPVQVETVAWITELKNTQSCLFYLLSILFFVRSLPSDHREEPSGRWRCDIATWLFGALAMASKSSTVVLPLVLCLCAWWIEGKWRWRYLLRVSPLFFMTLAAGALAIWTVKLQGVDATARSGPERLITAGYVAWFYLGKLVWPYPLIFIYPRWEINAQAWLGYLPLLALLVSLGIFWAKRHSWGRPYFFAFAYFLVALSPVLGLVNHYFLRYSFVADHLQYLASMGPLALVGAGIATWENRFAPRRIWLTRTLTASLLLVLGVMSWNRAWVYQNPQTLWTDTLAKNPNCWMAENNLGDLQFEQGHVDSAITDYQKALAISPDFAEVYNNLGVALSRQGRTAEAMTKFERALELDPDLASAHNHLGNVLLQRGQADAAIDQFAEAARLNPYSLAAHYNLGNALLQQSRASEAVAQYQDVLTINPAFAQAHSNLGLALIQTGQVAAAMAEFEKALALNPKFAQAHNNLGLALAQSGQVKAALAQFQEAVRLQPNYVAAQNNLARAISILNPGQ